MFQNVISQAEIGRRIIQWPARTIEGEKFIEKGIILCPRVGIESDDFLAFALQNTKISAMSQRISKIRSAPTANVHDNAGRLKQRLNAIVENHCSINIRKAAKPAFGVIVFMQCHQSLTETRLIVLVNNVNLSLCPDLLKNADDLRIVVMPAFGEDFVVRLL